MRFDGLHANAELQGDRRGSFAVPEHAEDVEFRMGTHYRQANTIRAATLRVGSEFSHNLSSVVTRLFAKLRFVRQPTETARGLRGCTGSLNAWRGGR